MTYVECINQADTLVTVVKYIAVAAVLCSAFRHVFGAMR